MTKSTPMPRFFEKKLKIVPVWQRAVPCLSECVQDHLTIGSRSRAPRKLPAQTRLSRRRPLSARLDAPPPSPSTV